MTKEEKIKEAWGKYWLKVKDYVDKNGWVNDGQYHNNKAIDFEIMEIEWEFFIDDFDSIIRPISLKGIENNNGWIKIESEEDLPKDSSIMYRIGLFLKDGKFHSDNNLCDIKTALKALNDNYTHYQPIEKPKPPIY